MSERESLNPIKPGTRINLELLNSVAQIAESAGREILLVYGRSGDIDVSVKADDSPLTEADYRANKLIVAELEKLTADIPVLSEESEKISFEQRRKWTRYWLVDPLDGTKEFIKRNGEFTVNIALIDRGKPVLGIVHVPVSGVTYLGLVGEGAHKRDANNGQVPIQCQKIVPGQSTLRVVASRSHRGPELDGLIEALGQRFNDIETLSMGSSLKICLVAEGAADLYPRLALTSEWDTAAAHAVLSAAGGTIVDTHFKELSYNTKEALLNPFFIAIADYSFPWQPLMKLD